MKNKSVQRLLYGALFVLYWLHNDLWLWNDGSLVFGMPVGLVYHFGFCVAACVMMYLLVTYAWPDHLEVDDHKEPKA